MGIQRYINGTAAGDNLCSCGHKFDDCDFWQQVLSCLCKKECIDPDKFDAHPQMSWRQILSLSKKDKKNFISQYGVLNDALFRCIATISGKELIVDSSKYAQRLYFLKQYGNIDLKVLHLIRNGKAVINSYIRKYRKPLAAIRRWAGVNSVAIPLKRMFQPNQWMVVSYEQLATEPVVTLQKICRYLDIEYDNSMLHFRKRTVHNLGGNRMIFAEDEQILLDEKWKRELKFFHGLLFDLLVGFLNKYYGY